MSLQPDGKYVCDRDGRDVGNGGILMALVVSDLDPDDPGMVRNLHFCRDEKDAEGTITHHGCAKKVLSARNMEHYTTQKKEMTDGT